MNRGASHNRLQSLWTGSEASLHSLFREMIAFQGPREEKEGESCLADLDQSSIHEPARPEESFFDAKEEPNLSLRLFLTSPVVTYIPRYLSSLKSETDFVDDYKSKCYNVC